MKIEIGDTVKFDFAGSEVTGTVESFYKRGNDQMVIAKCSKGYKHPIEKNKLKK